MAILAKAFFAFVRSDLVSFTLLSTWHTTSFLNEKIYVLFPYNGLFSHLL